MNFLPNVTYIPISMKPGYRN